MKKEGRVFIVTLKNGENRFSSAFVGELNKALDEVEQGARQDGAEGGAAMVMTAEGKFFSNGLDLEHALGNPSFVPTEFEPLLRRVLSFPIPTVAAINGHAFAGGFMLALAHDYRIMRKGRGFLCLNGEFGCTSTPPPCLISLYWIVCVLHRSS